MNSIVNALSKAIAKHNSRLWLSNLPPPTVKPMQGPSGMVFHMDYVYHSTWAEDKEFLNLYITECVVDFFEQAEWTEKTIRTRKKLEKLEKAVRHKWLYPGAPKNLYEEHYEGNLSPMCIIEWMIDSVKVDEVVEEGLHIRVRMLSPKGVEWCNGMWEKVK